MIINIGNGILHLKWNVIFHQLLCKCPRLTIGSAKNGNITVLPTLTMIIKNFFNHAVIFFFLIIEDCCNHRVSFTSCRLDLFCKAVFIISNHLNGRIHNLFSGSVIGIQQNTLCLRVIFFKSQHNFRSCTAKTINGLIIVSHHKKVVIRSCQQFYYIILQLIHILGFINQNILKFILPGL